MKQEIILSICIVAVVAAAGMESVDHKPAELPNVVFLMADDLGNGDVGYNKGPASTPNIDSMASGPHTLQLSRYYSGGPVCSPTRGTILTGRNHNRYCVWSANTGSDKDDFVVPQKMPLPPTEITVPELLAPLGYQSAIFGKWHLGDVRPVPGGNSKWNVSHPGMHGFSQWLVTERSAQNTNLNCACYNDTANLCVLGHYTSPPPCFNYYTITDPKLGLQTFKYPIQGDDSHFIVDLFEEFLNKTLQSKKPFFAYLPLHAVHIRYIASLGYIEQYEKQGYSQEEIDYYGSITAMDSAVGRVRALLKRFAVENNTMLWFTSDNGPLRGSPGRTNGLRGWKTELYEGGIRVPGLIEWPSVIPQNTVSGYPVVSSDLLPTLCDVLGIQQPSDRPIDGQSIMPLLTGRAQTRNSSIKWAFNIKDNFSNKYHGAISGDQYKAFVQFNNRTVASKELYDLLADPSESSDLSHQHPDILDSLVKELVDWLDSVETSAKDKVKCFGLSENIPS